MTDRLPSLIAHMAWADHRTLAMLRVLPTTPTQALSLFAHMVGAQHIWLTRVADSAPTFTVWPTLSLDECARLASENNAAFLLIAGGDATALSRIVRYTNVAGNHYENSVADILLHVTHHAMYHRGQVTLLVREAGGTPLATDYIAFLRD